MIPGDHLQLYYHFTLVSGFLSGDIPPFYNLYEFNTGSDDDRYLPGPYYAPFSIAFAVLAPVTGPVAAWNLVGLLSLWITLWLTWTLVLRYVPDPLIAGTAAAVSVTFPYRWAALAGGSPTGLGMMWVPAAFLGLELMVVDRRVAGGFLAGLSIYLSSWVDDHVFFFIALSSPLWILFSWTLQKESLVPRREDVPAYTKAALPLVLFMVPVAAQVLATGRRLSGTELGSGGRPLSEVALFSPRLKESLVFWKGVGTGEIYLGIVLVALVLLGLLSVLPRKQGGEKRGRLPAGIALCIVMIAGLVLLSTGTNNPLGPKAWKVLTGIVPPYGMIRNPTKIYCLLPTFLAVAAALSLKGLTGLLLSTAARRGLVLAVGVLLFFDYHLRLDPQICLLDGEQKAYAAIVDDSSSAERPPRMLALPLWPGNSHWTSVNQYFAALYGIRMVNGYKPTVPNWYRENIYRPFEQLNKGSFPDPLLDRLLSMGVDYIVLHEDAFPEKVSPFGVSHTLHRLLESRRIFPLTQDRGAWSFRIGPAGEKDPPTLPDWSYRSNGRLWEMERGGNESAEVVESDSSSRQRHLRLKDPAASATTSPYAMYSLEHLQYLVRMRGAGKVTAAVLADGERVAEQVLALSTDNWTWMKVAVPPFEGYRLLSLGLSSPEGAVDADLAGLYAPEHALPLGEKTAVLPAPVFFHAGYTDPQTGEVVLSPERVPADIVFYGPRTPLASGTYSITAELRSTAAHGTPLGRLFVRRPEGSRTGEDIVAGRPFFMMYEHASNLPFSLGIDYSGNGTLMIKSVTLEPVQ
jgi:hypothetical protein